MDVKEFEALLSDAETRLDRLKALYEQYFQGMERLEPTIPRKDFERRLFALRKEQPRNTAMRFRMQTLVQKYTSFQTYWTRTTRQIEEGTYRRDILKARRRKPVEASAPPSLSDVLNDLPQDFDFLSTSDAPDPSIGAVVSKSVAPPSILPASVSPPPTSSIPPTPTRPKAPPPPPPSAAMKVPPQVRPPMPTPSKAVPVPPPRVVPQAPPPPLRVAVAKTAAAGSEEQMRRIYSQYVEARKRNNESADVKYETLAKSIQEMIPKLQSRHNTKSVDFEIVIRDGKVGLKPVVKK